MRLRRVVRLSVGMVRVDCRAGCDVAIREGLHLHRLSINYLESVSCHKWKAVKLRNKGVADKSLITNGLQENACRFD
jgi:hypothetical protein